VTLRRQIKTHIWFWNVNVNSGLFLYAITLALSLFHTFCNSLEHALSLLSQLCRHHYSGNGFQWHAFHCSRFPNCPCVPAIAILSQLLHSYYFLKDTHSRRNQSKPVKKDVGSQTLKPCPINFPAYDFYV
jgi:hypothetical protein